MFEVLGKEIKVLSWKFEVEKLGRSWKLKVID